MQKNPRRNTSGGLFAKSLFLLTYPGFSGSAISSFAWTILALLSTTCASIRASSPITTPGRITLSLTTAPFLITHPRPITEFSTDFKSYYNANLSLIDMKNAVTLFDKNWPIYTRTNDSCPTKYYEGASVKSSVISNGCKESSM